ncbi:glycosyltransferase involved in cell wall biosynthesis [Arthrobacter sp. JUb119]|nr:glycosyltransferase involved in cell wall biosynthesis [Arthrobacter sp. JUb119]
MNNELNNLGPLTGKTILCAIDEESANLEIYRQLVAQQISALRTFGAEIVVIHPAGRIEAFPTEYLNLDVDVLTDAPIDADSDKNRARILAQRAVRYGAQGRYDIVLAFGWTLCRGIAGGRAIASKFWAFVDDCAEAIDRATWTNKTAIDGLYLGSRKVFVFSEAKRSILESSSTAANGRTYLPVLVDRFENIPQIDSSYIDASHATIVFPGLVHPKTYIGQLAQVSEFSKDADSPLNFVFHGTSETWNELQSSPTTAVAAAIPGLICTDKIQGYASEITLGLVPSQTTEKWIVEFLVFDYLSKGIVPISVDSFLNHSHLGTLQEIAPERELNGLGINIDDISSYNAALESRLADTIGAQKEPSHAGDTTNIVLAGADFKFAGDLVELLNESTDFSLRIDLWKNNSQPNATQSKPFIEWADVVICEFASFNAIWYSQNKRAGQKLIVRLHGYELLQPWIDQLEMANVDQVVFVSEFYRQKAIETKGWPAWKTSVVSNTVDFGDLARPKLDGSQFHLGMAGYVPILKRPDRALDLLEELLEHDDRFVLHMRGHEPWNYSWEWKKQAHQAAYRDFYARIAANENLRAHIAFEGFGPDMAGWFRKIGWMLSPSYRETFHLAPVEGMASGALPIVWDRDGATEIYPSDLVVSGAKEAAALILSTISDERAYAARALQAQEFATRYSRSVVKSEWISLIHKCQQSVGEFAQSGSTANQSLEALIEQHESSISAVSLLNVVSESWKVHDYATSISLLDANMKLTANDTGELKQWEHWIRGIFQTAMSLESLLLKRVAGCVYQTSPSRAVVVSDLQTSKKDIAQLIEGFAISRVGIEIPIPGRETVSQAEGGRDSGSVGFDYEITFDGSLRSNFYLAQTASEIASIFRNTAASVAISTGGILESLATLLAARRVGIPFVWQPSSSELATEFLSTFAEIRNDDPVHEIYQAVLANTDALLDSGSSDCVAVALSTDLPLDSKLTANLVDSLTRESSDALGEKTTPLSVAYIGDGASLVSVSLLAEVTVCTAENVFEVLDLAPDMFVIDYAHVADPKSRFAASAELCAPAQLALVQKAIIHARLMGARSIFISRTDPETLPHGKELARKCDVLVSSDRKSLISYMRLNPNSNQVAVNASGSAVDGVLPKMSLSDVGALHVCNEPNDFAEALAAGLAHSQPVLAGWRTDNRWSDTNFIGDNDSILRFEQSNDRRDGNEALWNNCFELSQGRTALDFAVYIFRAAGFAVSHPRGIIAAQLSDSLIGQASPNRRASTELVALEIDSQVLVDDLLVRDLLSVYRVSDAARIKVIQAEPTFQEIELETESGARVTCARSTAQVRAKDLGAVALSDFSSSGVSIIVATYMGAARLPRLLESILEQKLPSSLIELIFVPNGPDDGTATVLEDWAAENDDIRVEIVTLETPGVALARNCGIEKATKEFVTFVDDDDYLEPNFLLSLYSRAERHTVVLGKLSDVDEETWAINRDTPTTRRVTELGGRVLPLAQRAGALGMNGAKLLPTWLVNECRYDSSLRSGEDVAFMAQLLKKPGMFVTSASDVPESSYMRVMRFNSISRREETFEFMVTERLEVMRQLLKTRAQSEYKGGQGAIDYLATGQLGFLKRFIQGSKSLAEHEQVLETIDAMGLSGEKILHPLLAAIHSILASPESVQDGKRISVRQNT